MQFERCAILITAFALLLFSLSTPASGQTTTHSPKYYHKWLDCTVGGGLRGFSSSCGIMNNYAYIFVGSIISATQISDIEKRLQLQPHEMFLGNAPDELTVITSRADCLQEIKPGDEWLFYLSSDRTTKQLVLEYGSPSGPIGDRTEPITMLRRLSRMTDSGIIIGDVQDTLLHDDHAAQCTQFLNVANHKIIAKRIPDGTEYSAFSDKDGHYEFLPLPVGSYEVTANTVPGLWADEGPTEIRAGSCTRIQFEFSPDGRISGHIRTPDGKPFNGPPWVNAEVVSEDGRESRSTFIDDDGFYEFRGLPPGRYFVGISIQSQPGTTEWRSRVYYPDVQTKELATTIDLSRAGIRTNIDLSFPQAPIEQAKDEATPDNPDKKPEQ
jgi:hypothetical protein